MDSYMPLMCWIIWMKTCAGDRREVTARPGEDVPLQPLPHRNASISLLVCSRSDLQEDGFVFFLRDGLSVDQYQHPSFRRRVELEDGGGGAAVVLRNVSVDDSGTYRCRLIMGDAPEHISTTQLIVTPSALLFGLVWPEGVTTVVLTVSVGVFVLMLTICAVATCKKRHHVTSQRHESAELSMSQSEQDSTEPSPWHMNRHLSPVNRHREGQIRQYFI